MKTMRRMRAAALLVPLVGIGGCGGSDASTPLSPSVTPPPSPQALPAGTTVSVVSGEDHGPVEGARVVLGTQEYLTDAAGRIVLAEAAPYGSFADIVAAPFLSRQTVVRRDGGTTFVLWPRVTAGGLNEAFTAQIVYTHGWSEEPEHGSSPLERIEEGVSDVHVWVTEAILEDTDALAAHEAAVEEMNASLQGRAVYLLSPTRPRGVVFEVKVDGSHEVCVENDALAYFRGYSNRRGEITGGEIVYCRLRYARSPHIATHELGHSVGLQHSYGQEELMNPHLSLYIDSRFSAREALAMRLLFERPAGNRFPDSDREVHASAGGARTTVCRGSPPV